MQNRSTETDGTRYKQMREVSICDYPNRKRTLSKKTDRLLVSKEYFSFIYES